MAMLALVSGPACKGKDVGKDQAPAALPAPAPTAADLDMRCELLGTNCGDKDTHVEKLVDECRQVAKQQVAKGCTDKAIALSDCYARELCGKADKVWAFVDLPVLAARNNKCVGERAAVDACLAR